VSGKVIKGPWRTKGERSTEDVEFINSIEGALQNRLKMIHGSISDVPIIELEALDRVMEILDTVFRTGE
jgi:hypothetical protein